MQADRQLTLKGTLTLAAACAVGALAGASGLVGPATANSAFDAQATRAEPAAVPNEPARDPGGEVRNVRPRGALAKLDRSGRKQIGKASYYADRYAGKTMADGTPMRLGGNNAASLTLPLGSTAMVTNLETGRSVLIKIQDRGPYVQGRIVDLSPATARKIGLGRRQGVVEVEVVPMTIPLANGTLWHARPDHTERST